MDYKEIAKRIFARNLKLDVVYITSSGRAFYEEHKADGFASGLKDKKIHKFSREEVRGKTQAEKDVISLAHAAEVEAERQAKAAEEAAKKVAAVQAAKEATAKAEKEAKEAEEQAAQEAAKDIEVTAEEVAAETPEKTKSNAKKK